MTIQARRFASRSNTRQTTHLNSDKRSTQAERNGAFAAKPLGESLHNSSLVGCILSFCAFSFFRVFSVAFCFGRTDCGYRNRLGAACRNRRICRFLVCCQEKDFCRLGRCIKERLYGNGQRYKNRLSCNRQLLQNSRSKNQSIVHQEEIR